MSTLSRVVYSPDTTPPSTPSGVIATVLSATSIRVTWAASTDTGGAGLSGYRVYRATASGGPYSQIGTDLSVASLTYDDTSLSAGQTRYYRVAAFDGNSNVSAQSSIVNATTSSSSWQLPAANYIPAKQTMIRIYPRPDAETSANARHRWAYYDGSNSVQYKIQIGVAFGAPPFHFELLPGAPSGMTIGQNYGDANYGIVTWTPSASVTNATVTVQVTDQGGATLDITWTVSTSSSTARFIFINRDTGSDSNSGAIGSPKQTIGNVFGSTFAATANAGAQVYLRGSGTAYTLPTYTDNDINSSYTCLQFHTTRKPMSLMGYPGESVTITGNRLVCFYSGADMFLQNLTFNGFPSVGNPRLLWFWTTRMCNDDVSWTASIGTSQTDNATMFFGSEDASTNSEYNYFNDCHESGRTSGGDNNYGFCSTYSQRYLLIERCTFTGAAGKSFYLKGTNQDVTVRYCTVNQTSGGHSMCTGFAPQGHSTRIEIAYNKVKTSNGASRYAFESPMGQLWHYRNSYYDTRIDVDTPSANGPYVFENNAIESDSSPIVDTGTQITNTGTECQGALSLSILDSTTLELLGSFRTSHLGKRGSEISA